MSDKTDPQISVVADKGRALIKEQITAIIEQSDTESGILKAKWIFNKTGEEIGTEESKYEDSTYKNGEVNSLKETIKFKEETEGVYYLHVLSIDNANNKKEIIAGPIVIKDNNSIIGEIAKIETSGYKNVTITGKISGGTEKTETYNVHTIVVDGDLELDGTTPVAGATLSTQDGKQVYEFGDATKDVATSSNTADTTYYAKSMVVLKVNGDLTIKENVRLTACKNSSGYGGPKGMTIFCSGTITNNGEISMTARGARAVGQDVFLWENKDENDTYEYVPKDGANGGESVQGGYCSDQAAKNSSGKKGYDSTERGTGGGGSGTAGLGDGSGLAHSGAGARGTSYSGGSGGGGCCSNFYSANEWADNADPNGGEGGAGRGTHASGWVSRYSGGGAGNPGGLGGANGMGNTTTGKGEDGTGLVVDQLMYFIIV